jgi:asparagine synthase (glutamine-hydrolysing)
MSMAYSTELREPFLDHQLVELSFALPLKFKIKGDQKKWILREIIRKYKNVPIVEAPKRPIQTPQREWLQNELKDWVIDTIQSGFAKYSFLNKQKTQVELDKYFKGEIENSFFIWQWITLGMI